MTVATDTTGEIRMRVSLWRRLWAKAVTWPAAHRRSLALLTPLLAVAAAVHAIGMHTYPHWVDDPGTYLSQAWSLRYERSLSPYSFFYDHAPGGWIQIALWATLTGGFDRYASAIDFGNECMLIAKLVSCALLFALGRRVGLSRLGSGAAVLLFALSPLAVTYTRWTFLDNLVTPWLLLAFTLAYSPRRSISAGMGAALAFGMAALTKETALVTLPAFVYAMARNLDPRNRTQVITVSAFSGVLLMSLYPLFAIYKGELFPGRGHNSLLETAYWQLAERHKSGSVLDPSSATHQLLATWLSYDWILLAAGVAALPIAFLARELRPLGLLLVIEWVVLILGGYVPAMHVITLLPMSALLAAAAVERLTHRGWAPAVAAVAAAAVWAPALWPIMSVRQQPPLLSATRWVADNVPRDKVLVVHDSVWVDLTHHYGFRPRPVIAYKLDTDPAVVRTVRHVDYLVVPNWYFRSADAFRYPTLLEARKHAIAVASFGSGDAGVKVYRVSRFWNPRGGAS